MKNSKIDQIENLIAKNQILSAVDLIKEILPQDSNLKEEVIICESRIRKIVSEDIQGTLSNEEKNIEWNKIRKSLLSITGALRMELKESDSYTESFKRSKQKEVIEEIQFADVEQGHFYMGSENGLENEKPVHKVEIEKNFQIGIVPITQKQWKVIMGSEPWRGMPKIKEGDKFPATYITWQDAETFINRLNALDPEFIYRFPTEAEWEYCCKANSKTEFHFGNNETQMFKYGWFDKNVEEAGLFYAQEVGLLKPNQWGIYDMHGNIWEWVNDWYIDSHAPEKKHDYIDDKVLKGGGWDYSAFGARAAFRYHSKPTRTNHVIGFRIVKEKR